MLKKKKGFKNAPIGNQTFYFHEKKILDVKDSKDGYKRVKLVVGLDDKGKEISEIWDIKAWELNACMTNAPSDATEGRNGRAIYVVDRLYDLLVELDVRIEEIPFILNKLLDKAKGREEQVRLNMFGKSAFDIRLSDWENNLTKEQRD